MARQRTDTERRARQADRLARLLRLLRLIMGSGRWDADSLAIELECSPRTIHRMLQCLEMAGVPWQFDNRIQAYRVPKGFKFPGLGEAIEPLSKTKNAPELKQVKAAVKQLISNSEKHLKLLKDFYGNLEP